MQEDITDTHAEKQIEDQESAEVSLMMEFPFSEDLFEQQREEQRKHNWHWRSTRDSTTALKLKKGPSF